MKNWYVKYKLYKFSEKITDYLDGNFTESEKEINELVNDPKIKKLVKLKQNLRSLPKQKTSPTFDAILRARLRREKQKSFLQARMSNLSLGWKMASYATVSLFLISVGIFLGKSFSNSNLPLTNNQISSSTTLPARQLSVNQDQFNNGPLKNYVIEHVITNEIDQKANYSIRPKTLNTISNRDSSYYPARTNSEVMTQITTAVQF